LIGEIVTIVTKAAIAAIRFGGPNAISKATIGRAAHVPISQRRNSALRETLL